MFNYDVIEDLMNINEAVKVHCFFMKYLKFQIAVSLHKKGCITRSVCRLGKREPILILLVYCSLYMQYFVFSSSSRLMSDGLATACDCGTP